MARDGRWRVTGDRRTSRRRFVIAAGALAGSVGIAGCPGSEPEREEAAPTPSPTPTEPDQPERDTETPEPEGEPPGEKRPIGEKYPDLRVVSTDPPVAEAASRETYTRYRTPIGEHYIVNHYDTPVLDAGDWTISLTGLPGPDAEITMRELRREYSTTTVAHTMQCSGNGRAYFEPEIVGYSLSFGALGTAEWTGAPLRELLEAYDADVEMAGWLMVAGADHPPGESVFARSIPAWKVLEDCVLAYEMNGTALPLEHGHPVRLIVPGWFGNNSVKWVDEMAVMDAMLVGEEWPDYHEWQQDWYRVLAAGEEADHREAIERFDTWDQMEGRLTGEIGYAPYMYDQPVKSTIGHPGEGAIRLGRYGGEIDVVGVAWAGDERIERVDISDDGGDTWGDAELVGPDRGAVAWRQFRYRWAPDPGEYRLVSRATDERGRTQPRAIAGRERGFRALEDGDYPWNQRGYGSNAYLPLGVDVSVER